jgi:hypothetical protein
LLSGAAGFANGKFLEQPADKKLQHSATNEPDRKREARSKVGQPGDDAGGNFSGAYSKACTSLA